MNKINNKVRSSKAPKFLYGVEGGYLQKGPGLNKKHVFVLEFIKPIMTKTQIREITTLYRMQGFNLQFDSEHELDNNQNTEINKLLTASGTDVICFMHRNLGPYIWYNNEDLDFESEDNDVLPTGSFDKTIYYYHYRVVARNVENKKLKAMLQKRIETKNARAEFVKKSTLVRSYLSDKIILRKDLILALINKELDVAGLPHLNESRIYIEVED
jgi:hypothetical protein